MLAITGSLSLTLLLAGSAAALVVTSPIREARRTAPAGSRLDVGEPAQRRWSTRADAAPLRTRVLLACAAAVAMVSATQSVGGVAAVAGLLVVPILVPVLVIGLGRLEPGRARRRRNELVLQVPQALELLSACLAAGMPLRQATCAVADAFEDGPVADDLQQVLALVELGASDGEAWRVLRPSAQWGPAVVDVARSVESGTMLVQALLHHAQLARELRRNAVTVSAKAVGVRSVLPLMMCFLPAFLLLGVVPTVASAVLNAVR